MVINHDKNPQNPNRHQN